MFLLRKILFLILCVHCAMANAQDSLFIAHRTFYGGITAGANFSALNGDVYDGYHKVGFNAGAVVYVNFLKQFGASVEILYSQKGCRGVREIYSNYVGNMFEQYYVNLNYVEVPLQVFVQTLPFLNVGCGLSYSRLINSKEWIESDQPYNIDNSLYAFKNDDWAFIAGGNLQIKKRWMATLRYQQSFRPVREPYYVPLNLGTGSQYNSYFTLRLTFLI